MADIKLLVDGYKVKRTLFGLSTGHGKNDANCTGYFFVHSEDVDRLCLIGVLKIDSRTGIVYQGKEFSTNQYSFRRNVDGEICMKIDLVPKRNSMQAFGCEDGVEVTSKTLKRNRKESLGDDAEERLKTKVVKRNRMQALGDYGDGKRSTKSKFLK